MEEFLKSLGINTENAQIDEEGDTLTIDLEDFDNFGFAYSKLDDCDALEACDDESNFNGQNGIALFEGEDFHVSVLADFDADVYTLVCEEN